MAKRTFGDGRRSRGVVLTSDPAAPSVVAMASGFGSAVIFVLLAWFPCMAVAGGPYPVSPVIGGISWDFSSHVERASGSDNWPITWADDGHQYTSWGDGGGFGGSNSDGRVSLGVARVAGPAGSYTGQNVWGGKNTTQPGAFAGKSYGMLSVGGTLYMWLRQTDTPTDGGETHARLALSTDHGANWTRAGWHFSPSSNLISPTFLNFGQDYAGARDDYVYTYFVHSASGGFDIVKPGMIDLARVAKSMIMDPYSYEFFGGLDGNGNPIWSTNAAARQPVFQDTNGVGWTVSVSYNAGLKRYLLMTEHQNPGSSIKQFTGNLGLFDAPEPWGPWTTVEYTTNDNWGGMGSTFFWNFSNKWTSADGLDTTLIFTGTDTRGSNDSWNTVRGTFTPCVPEPNAWAMAVTAIGSLLVWRLGKPGVR